MATERNGRGEAGNQQRLAVLIDADNAQASVIDALLAEVARYGSATVRRIYGDWTSPNQNQWKKVLLRNSIAPVQQFAYTSGKNSTDSALIIDAMDLMHTHRFDGFCLVSSDSDFTRLAQRLREEGLTVYGFGEKKTPAPFVAACDKFIYTEVLRASVANDALPVLETSAPNAAVGNANPRAAAAPATATKSANATKPGTVTKSTTKPPATPKSSGAAPIALPEPFDLIMQAIDESDDESGWAHLGAVGSYLTKVRPDFDSRLYGHSKLSQLLRSQPKLFELEERSIEGGAAKSVFVRPRT